MKTVFIILCIILFLPSCDVVDAPTGACRYGPLGTTCSETTANVCYEKLNGVWYEGETCP